MPQENSVFCFLTTMVLYRPALTDTPVSPFLPIPSNHENLLHHKHSLTSIASTTSTITSRRAPKYDILEHQYQHNEDYNWAAASFYRPKLPRELYTSDTVDSGVYLVDYPCNPFNSRLACLSPSPSTPYPSIYDGFWSFPKFSPNYAPALLLDTTEEMLLGFTHSEHHAIAYALHFHNDAFQYEQPQAYSICQHVTFDYHLSASSFYKLMKLLSMDGSHGWVLAVAMKDEGGHYPVSSPYYSPVAIYIPLYLLGPSLLQTHHYYADLDPKYSITPALKLNKSGFDNDSFVFPQALLNSTSICTFFFYLQNCL